MDSGLVTALSGALAQSRRVDLISNNLANADTPGFKGDDLAFEETLTELQRQDDRSDIPERPATDRELFHKTSGSVRPVLYGAEFTNLKAGGFRQTNNPLDVAIEGNGFLEVLSPAGVRLTRAGNLSLDAQGRLVTRDGFPVLGAGQGDPARRVIRVGNANINIDVEGNIYNVREGNALVGKLSLVQVANPRGLKKTGNNLFEASAEAGVTPVGQGGRQPAGNPDVNVARENPLGPVGVNPRVHQGMLEGSNVNPVQEMTKLIQTHRLFDQNIKVMESVGQLSTSELGKF